MVFGLGLWVRSENKGRGSFGLCADARRLGQGDLARGGCAVES